MQVTKIQTLTNCSHTNKGGKNHSLANQLGITTENSKFPHPKDKNRFIVWLFDFVHIFKNICNHLLDNVVQFPYGNIICSDDFWDLLELVQGEITDGFHLKEEHLLVQGNDRQSVPLTCQLLRYHSYITYSGPYESLKI